MRGSRPGPPHKIYQWISIRISNLEHHGKSCPPPSAPPSENSEIFTKRLVGNYGYLHVDTNDSDSHRANIPRQILVLVMHGNIAGFLILRLNFIEVIVLLDLKNHRPVLKSIYMYVSVWKK